MQTVRLFPDTSTPEEQTQQPLISNEVLKPFMLHPDRHVREFVSEYFVEACYTDPELMGLVLDGCEKYGDEDNLLVLARGHSFCLSEQNFLRVLNRFQEIDEIGHLIHYSGIVSDAPCEWFVKYENDIRRKAKLSEQHARKINKRREMLDYTPGQAWEALQEYNSECEKSDTKLTDVDRPLVDCLIDLLAVADEPSDNEICTWLSEDTFRYQFLECWLIDLAGVRGIEGAVPILVDKLKEDADYLRERVNEALARIGSVEAVNLVEDTFAEDEWHVRLFSINVPMRIKSRRSESFFLEQLGREQDSGIRTLLCEGLCKLFSKRGLDVVRNEIKSGYDTGMLSLEDMLLDTTTVLDIDLPEAQEWKAAREERERLQKLRREELSVPLNKSEKVLRDLQKNDQRKKPRGRISGKKVGRNDPCPCGSGRKYKKCCNAPGFRN